MIYNFYSKKIFKMFDNLVTKERNVQVPNSNCVILFRENRLVTLSAQQTRRRKPPILLSLNTEVQTEPKKGRKLSSDFKNYQKIL